MGQIGYEPEAKEKGETRPLLIETPDLTKLRSLCTGYIDALEKGEHDDDTEHYIFEEAMMTLFGADVFKYTNKLMK